MKRGNEIIGETFGSDVREISECRYQPTRTRRAVYTIGDRYYTVNAGTPTELGMKWQRHPDQFFAQRAGTVLWFAEMNDGAES